MAAIIASSRHPSPDRPMLAASRRPAIDGIRHGVRSETGVVADEAVMDIGTAIQGKHRIARA
ncbi:hypothetical protein GCM10028792_27320 [Salinisphaera aquimarina]